MKIPEPIAQPTAIDQPRQNPISLPDAFFAGTCMLVVSYF
jgi:hypothetical protein